MEEAMTTLRVADGDRQKGGMSDKLAAEEVLLSEMLESLVILSFNAIDFRTLIMRRS
jgi:hypothetical protein